MPPSLTAMLPVRHRPFEGPVMRDTFDKSLTFTFRQTVSRYPCAEEAAIVEETLARHLARYNADAGAAQQLIAFGDSKTDPA